MATAAHEDDTLLFMSPDILHDIQSGRCVRTIFVTAGDAGDGLAYWMGREKGSEAGYASMAGVPNVWTQADAGVPGHPMPLLTLNGNPRVSVVFMRLPDGLGDGSGFSSDGFQSLQKLYFGQITTIHAVDGSSSYTRSDLTTTLASLIDAMSPDRIDTQDFAGVYGDGDHSDHHTVAYLTRDAHRLATITTAHTLYGYMDYPSAEQPSNVTGADLTAKTNAYFAYAPFDVTQCQTPETCAHSPISAWLSRQYNTGSEAGGPGTSFPPFAIAGPNQTVNTDANVQLLGAASYDSSGSPSFQWTQTAGPTVTLSSPTAASPTFTAPPSASTLEFQMTVTEGGHTSAPATMTVTVAPPAVLASPQYGVPNQTDVFDVNSNGAVEVRWVESGGAWQGPRAISPPGLAIAGTHLAVSNQFGLPNQTDVFLVDNDGAISVLWVAGTGAWQGPMEITPTDSAPPGAHLAVSNQFGLPNQTDVFAVNDNGATQVSWVAGAGAWQGPTVITPPNTSPPGAGIAASNQFGNPTQTDVFTVGGSGPGSPAGSNKGATQVSWVAGAGAWQGPMVITPPNTSPPGAGIAASNQFGNPTQTDVFTVNNDGATQVSWVLSSGAWQGPLAITPNGTVSAGANLAASNQYGASNQTDVFFVSKNGATQVSWVSGTGAWQGPMNITATGNAVIGASLAASNQFGIPNQTDVFVINHTGGGSPQVVWVQGDGAWQGPLQM